MWWCVPSWNQHSIAITVNHNTHCVIETGANQYVAGRRMPFDVQNFTLMPQQLHFVFAEVWCETAFGNLPYFDLREVKSNHQLNVFLQGISSSFANRTIVRGGRDDIIVERIPLEIQNLSTVTNHLAALKIDATSLANWNHNERGVSHNGQEWWIYNAEVTIVGAHGS